MLKKILLRFQELLILGRSEPLKNYREVIGWWEVQRVTYNLVVGITGIITGLIISCIGVFSSLVFNSDFGIPDPPLFAIVMIPIYAFLANVFYTGGWVGEIIVRRLCDLI